VSAKKKLRPSKASAHEKNLRHSKVSACEGYSMVSGREKNLRHSRVRVSAHEKNLQQGAHEKIRLRRVRAHQKILRHSRVTKRK